MMEEPEYHKGEMWPYAVRLTIRLLTFLEIIPLKLFPRLWIWLLVKLGRI